MRGVSAILCMPEVQWEDHLIVRKNDHVDKYNQL